MKSQNKTKFLKTMARYSWAKTYFPIILILLAGLILSCNKANTVEEENPEIASETVTLRAESSELLNLKSERVNLRTIPIEIIASGKIGLNEKRLVHITSRVSGWVEKVYAFVGDRVQTGDTLVSIYSPEFLSAQAEFIQAEERLKSIPNSDSIEHRTALALYQSAKAKLILFGNTEKETNELEDNHRPQSHLTIRAPFSGTVIESNVLVGNAVEKSANLFQLSDLSSLWITANVYEKDIGLIKRGQSVKIKVSAVPGKTFVGTAQAINDILDETTRTFKVRIEVENREGLLKPEMFCEAYFTGTSPERILAVPENSVQTLAEEQIVFAVT